MKKQNIKKAKRSTFLRGLTLFIFFSMLMTLLSPVKVGLAAVSPPVFRLKWGIYGSGTATNPVQFDTPMGVAVNLGLNRVYVVDTFNNRIQYFDMNGVYTNRWSAVTGLTPNVLNYPQGIAARASTNEVYVADTYNNRIVRFSSYGSSATAIGAGSGTGDRQFRRPFDVTLDSSGNVYVADTFNHRIQKLNSTGSTLLLKFGSYGSGNGQFLRPSGVAVDSTGSIYVVDENDRVQKFSASGVFMTSWGTTGSLPSQFNMPRDVNVDSTGNVYVTDTGNDRIQKFSSSGVFITEWGTLGTANGQFRGPWSIAVFGNDDLFVADTDNNRVQRFEPNQSPTDIALATPTFVENLAVGSVVSSLQTTDPNTGDSFTYQLVAGSGDTDNAAFTIAGTNLQTAQVFDYEARTTYSIRVRSSDSGGLPTEKTLTLTVLDGNDAPQIGGGPFTVLENSPVGTDIGTVVVTDQDQGSASFTFAITGGNSENAFAIHASTGHITVANSTILDYETTPTFTLTVEATDTGIPTGTPAIGSGTITINLLQFNDPPSIPETALSVPENSPAGTVVGTVTASDPDMPGQILSYAIIGGNDSGAFAIHALSGEIRVADSAPLDRETAPSFTLTIEATDNGVPPLSGSGPVTIQLTDVNEYSPVLNDAGFDLLENSAPGSVVGSVAATDGDTGSTFTYAITGGNASGAFQINALSGQISVLDSAPVDFEVTPTFVLTVQVMDSGTPGRTGSASISIDLLDVNDTPAVAPAAFDLPENSLVGTVVGAVHATDQDRPAQIFTWEITAGNDAGAFQIDPASGEITVANSTPLNFESTPSMVVTVGVTDNGVPPRSGSAEVTIHLTNVNETPTVPPQSMMVPENSANGTSLGTAAVSDPDAGSSFTYLVTGGTGSSYFAVGSGTGEITVSDGSALNFEATPLLTLAIQVTDNGTPALQTGGLITISLTNVNEPPSIDNASFILAENSLVGTVVGGIPASDVDAGSEFHYEITAGNALGAFAIADTGQITVANDMLIDFETTPLFTLTVQVTDNGVPALTDTAEVTITLQDFMEQPQISDQSFSIAENSAGGTAVGTVVATDPDVPAQTLSYAITGGNSGGAFGIDPASGQITVAVPGAVDFETTPLFSLTVRVTDSGYTPLQASAVVSISLLDRNDAPVVTAETFTLAENSAAETIVGTTHAADQDLPVQGRAWSIVAGNTSGAFTINASTGVITVANPGPLNFEGSPNTFALTVQMTDDGTPPLSGSATITVQLTNVNDAPVVSGGSFNLPENSLVGAVVGIVTAADQDVPVQSRTWIITAGNSSGAFAIDSSNGTLTVASSDPLNFEGSPNSFNLTVQMTDGGTPPLAHSAQVAIVLTDVNEAPVVQPSAFSVLETSPIGTPVGAVSAADIDAGQTLSYSITGGNTSGAFAIHPTNGQITVANPAVLDYPATPPFNLTVLATDNGAPALSHSAQIGVTVLPAPDLALTSFSGLTSVLSGSDVLYVVQLANQGPGNAGAFQVEVTLPASASLTPAGSTASCSFNAPKIICPIAGLDSSAVTSLNLVVHYSDSFSGVTALNAQLIPGGLDLNAANHTQILPVTVNEEITIVSDDFESGASACWSSTKRTAAVGYPDSLPDRWFLGEFSNELITCSAANLLPHSQVRIEFDLFIIRSWDGNSLLEGPDQFILSLGGNSLLRTTYTNWDDGLHFQAYPDPYPGGSNPYWSGAEEHETLGFRVGANWPSMDSVYHIEMTVDHSTASLLLGLQGSGLQTILDESWGFDNFRMTLIGKSDYAVYLPMLRR